MQHNVPMTEKLPDSLALPETVDGQVTDTIDHARPVGIATIRGRTIKMYQFTEDQKIGFLSVFRSLERNPDLGKIRRYFDVFNRQAINSEDMDWLDDQVMFEGLTYTDIIEELFTAMGLNNDPGETPKNGPQPKARRARK
jgi:hypothetical protein